MNGRWKKLRTQVIARDGMACVQCMATERLEVDHIWEIEDGGSWSDPANLQTLCHDCHVGKTSIAAQKRAGTFERNSYCAYEDPEASDWRGIVGRAHAEVRARWAVMFPESYWQILIVDGKRVVFSRYGVDVNA